MGKKKTLLKEPRIAKFPRLGNLGPEDMFWLRLPRDNREIIDDDMISFAQEQRDDLAKKIGPGPDTPLEAILRAIIRAKPSKVRPDEDERLESALAALRGGWRKRGQKELADYDILLEIAWRYFVEYETGWAEEPELRSIVASVVNDLPKDDPRRLATDTSVLSRFEGKFRRRKLELLTRVTGESYWTRESDLGTLLNVIDQLQALGIAVDKSAVPIGIPTRAFGQAASERGKTSSNE